MDLKNRKEVFEKEDYLDAETGYPERDVNWFTNHILPDFLSLDFVNKDKTLLDVGCAHGYFTKVMCDSFKHTLGIDFAENRLNYTVIGNNVNLTARLCAAAGPGEIFISADVLKEKDIADHVVIEDMGPLHLKGYEGAQQVYKVKGLKCT